MEKSFPLIAVLGPAAYLLDSGEGCGRHAVAEAGFVGDALHAVCEAFEVADGQNETFYAVGEEVFRAGGGGGDDGAAAGEGLSLNEG